ncbi:MAG: copper chaperone PCu(A)C [Acidimicrobiia bacterium]
MASIAIVASGCGGGDGPSTLSVSGAWARPTPASADNADNAVVYLSIVSPIDDEIVAVSVPESVAAEAQLHESMEAGDSGAHQHGGSSGGVASDSTGSGTAVMIMEPLASVPLKAKSVVNFEPGGKHIMLVGLAGPLVRGQHFDITITMKSASPLVASVAVQDNAP